LLPPSSSGQLPFHLGQESCEVEPAGTGGPGGFKVSAGPVAGFRGKLGVKPAGFAPVPVVLVVGQKPREVAQLGPRAGGNRATAVTVGAKHGAVGESRVAKLANIGCTPRGKNVQAT
jgi:hypothetical protein